mgnify:CR=1 FL=1
MTKNPKIRYNITILTFFILFSSRPIYYNFCAIVFRRGTEYRSAHHRIKGDQRLFFLFLFSSTGSEIEKHIF